ncbi:unnamed protein product [Parnassius apollo]|uniref:(apollo) hypothetical protein n=1 Tax=Parnassius apollo TaxID=110799 RepID=A0A8S3XXL8_PARAO|nr:unnamed protein product [Parnassius apollo]
MIQGVKKKFGLDAKNIYAVTDAGSNVKRAVSLGNMEHHLCLGHALHNLVTVDGIDSVPEVKELVNKCKKIVKTVRYRLPEVELEAEKVQKEFLDSVERVVETLEIDESNPILQSNSQTATEASIEWFAEDMSLMTADNCRNIPSIKTTTPTRWHSILEMLESLIHVCNRDPINNMLRKVGKDELKITQNEWILLEDLVKFLNRFREAVEIMSSQKTCTMNVALVFRSEIIDVLKSLDDDESLVLFRLKRNMLANIDKRFPVTKPVVAAALLDKRFMGLKELDLYLESKNMTKASFLASYIKEVIKSHDLPGNCERNETYTSVSLNTSSSSSILSKLSKKHSAGHGHGLEDIDPLDQECWRYLASAVGSTDINNEDLLSFWNEKKKQFPWLSTFARALLCVPATSTPSERVFSVAGMVLSAKRSRLSPQRVNKIIFIHDNYRECKNYKEN